MSVNGITGVGSTSPYGDSYTTSTNATTKVAEETTETGVIYEKSEATEKTYTPNAELVAKLKADAESKTEQLRSLVEKILIKQGTAYNNANGMWKLLASGEFTVGEATIEQAQADIAEDGYYGVTQTSDRIIDFATALTGGDPEKMQEMKEAFEKGYAEAEKTWGGELPEICKKTYDAVLEKFEALTTDASLQ